VTDSVERRKKRLRRWLLNKGLPCAHCGVRLTAETLTLDRYPVPGREGGGYTRNNVRPMCAPCNNAHLGEPTFAGKGHP
jgi:hypothetical protein